MPDRSPKPQPQTGSYAPKSCAACGRTMTWRKAWAKNWDEVKFCSERCRAEKPSAQKKEQSRQLESAILHLLAQRGAGKTICPSEAARAVAGSEERAAWEPLMEPARAAARRLVAREHIVITQGGHVVDGSTAKGPIRLRLR